MSHRGPLATVSSYLLATSAIACLSLLALATCGKDSPTRTTPTPQPPTPQPPMPQPPTPPQPARITITPSSVNLVAIGQTVQLSATVYDNANVQIPGAEVAWSSTDPAVVTVSVQGLVKAVNNGMAQIRARSGNISSSIAATVSQTPASITIEPMTAQIAPDKTVQLQANVFDQNGHPVSSVVIAWMSSDVNVATVSAQGLVTAVSKGTATITARSGSASQTATITVGSSVSSDREALLAIYHSTNGPVWHNSTNWLSNAPLSTWHGVEANSLGEVQSLDLRENNLQGDIPSDIGLLKELNVLRLEDNLLTGNIPTEIGQLKELTYLSLRNNQLKGHIPSDVGLLQDLTALGLDNNLLTGSIPTEIGQLQKLTFLNLSNNQLTGNIPIEIGQLQKLTFLGLDNNLLTGNIPTEIGQLQKLTFLNLSNNQLTGNIPTETGLLQELSTLSLLNNQLTGDIPPEIGQLRELTFLNLSSNQLSGDIPAGIDHLQKLAVLSLLNNQLTGGIPPEIGQLTELTFLGLGNNLLTGIIPPEIGRLQKLKILNLGINPGLAGPLPETLIMLTNLETLRIQDTQICIPLTAYYLAWLEGIPNRSGGSYCPSPQRDALVALYDRTDGPNWTNSTNWKSIEPLDRWFGVTTEGDGTVTGLVLENNNLNGTVPADLGELTHLKTLNLSFNAGLTGIVPVSVSRLELEVLDLDGTMVCAPPDAGFQQWLKEIPQRAVTNCADMRPDYYVLARLYHSTNGKNWTNRTNWLSDAPLNTWHGVRTNAFEEVTGLDLRENGLVGTIPSEIGQLKHLVLLNLGLNQLTGKVPSEISRLESITHLYLHSNQLTGNIPSEIEQLKNLNELRFDQNRLSGNIPPGIGNLRELQDLRLHRNQLTGTIPSEIGHLRRLRNLILSENRLTGDIPLEIWRLQNLKVLILRGDAYLRDSGNQLTGAIPPEVAALKDLEYMSLEFNQLTGNIPPDLGKLGELLQLRLSGNQFTGTIPSEIGRLHNLTNLALDNNQLTGDIPSEIGQLLNLRSLDLSSNELEGTIPAEIGRLTYLKRLTLNDNQLTGTLPSEIAGLGMLEVLGLSYNRLSGSIPGSFGGFANLRLLGLTDNSNMSGPLPLSLTSLNLDDLLLGGTMLCMPETTAFRTWLREIPNSRVSRCETHAGRSVAYVTQAVQSLEYPVPLVAGEDALLRVFVTSETDMDANMPHVRATFYEGGAELHTVDIQSQETPIPTEVYEGDLSTSANARIPGSVLTPGLEMVIEIDPEGMSAPDSGIIGRLPEEGRIAIDVREVPPFDLTMVPFLWTENPDRSILAQVEGLTADSDLFRLTRDILPVGEFQLTIREPVWTSVEPITHNFRNTLRETVAIHALDDASGHYMGVLTGKGAGLALQPGTITVSTLEGPFVAHELGHNMNLGHAPCHGGGTGLDPDYPYSDGFIGAWGYDLLNEMLVHPRTWDIMSCGPPDWISDYFFNKALGYRLYNESETLLAAAFGPSGRSLLLWGGVNSDGELVLEPAFVVDASLALPELDGPYQLTGQDDDDSTLFSLRFSMAEIACGDGGGAFAFIIPARATWSNRLAEITLSGPEGVATLGGDIGLDGQDAPAAALLLDSVTGNVRGILRDWPEPGITGVAARRVLPEPGLDAVISSGVPDAADWNR